MRWMVVLALAGNMAGAAFADETQTQTQAPSALPLKLPAHAQPTQTEIDHLSQSEKSKLSVDTSSRDQKEVDQLYRQLAHKPQPGSAEPPGK